MVDESDPETVPGGVFVAGAGKFPDDVSVIAASGEGATIRTESGDEYVDYVLGGGPLIVGHAHPEVVDRVKTQAEDGTTFYLTSELGVELANRIRDAVPSAEQVKLGSSGSQVTYFAMRLARAYTGSEKILKFGGAYHGWHDYAMRSSSYADAEELAATTPPDGTVDSAGIVDDASDSVLVAPYNDLERTTEIVEEHAEDLAAIFAEPMMRSLEPVDGFLEGLRDLCDEHDIVLVFDEVVTGFRLAWGGGQEYYGVTPDLTTLGKAVGGGTPMAAVCGREEIMRLSDPQVPKEEQGAYISGTLAGNPLCAAAGLAALDVLDRPGTYDHLHGYGDRFRDLIDDVLADSPLSGTTLAEGPVVDYALTEESTVIHWDQLLASDSETKRAIDRKLLDQGIIQIHGAKRYVSTEHGDREFERTAEAFKTAVEDVA
jgi:glutamate-1-semialdehyde 2,1-aminomutase